MGTVLQHRSCAAQIRSKCSTASVPQSFVLLHQLQQGALERLGLHLCCCPTNLLSFLRLLMKLMDAQPLPSTTTRGRLISASPPCLSGSPVAGTTLLATVPALASCRSSTQLHRRAKGTRQHDSTGDAQDNKATCTQIQTLNAHLGARRAVCADDRMHRLQMPWAHATPTSPGLTLEHLAAQGMMLLLAGVAALHRRGLPMQHHKCFLTACDPVLMASWIWRTRI